MRRSFVRSHSLFATVLYAAFLALFTLPILADVPFTSAAQFSGSTTHEKAKTSSEQLPDLPALEPLKNPAFKNILGNKSDWLTNETQVNNDNKLPSFTNMDVPPLQSVVNSTSRGAGPSVELNSSIPEPDQSQKLVTNRGVPPATDAGSVNFLKSPKTVYTGVSLGHRQTHQKFKIETPHYPTSSLTKPERFVKKVLQRNVKDQQIRRTVLTFLQQSTLSLT